MSVFFVARVRGKRLMSSTYGLMAYWGSVQKTDGGAKKLGLIGLSTILTNKPNKPLFRKVDFLAHPACKVGLGALVRGVGEHRGGVAILNQLAEVHKHRL